MSELLWTSPDIALSDLPSLGKAALFFLLIFLSSFPHFPAILLFHSSIPVQGNREINSDFAATCRQLFPGDYSRALVRQIHPGDSQYRPGSVSPRVNCFSDPFLVPWRGINGDVRPLGSFSHPSWNHYNIMTEQGQVKSLAAPITLLQVQPAWEKQCRNKSSIFSNAKCVKVHSVSSDYNFSMGLAPWTQINFTHPIASGFIL